MAEKSGKKRKNRFALVLLVLCAVLALAALSTMGEDGFHFAALRRRLMYGDSGETGDAFSYAADPDSRFAPFGDGLLVVTPHVIQFHGGDGAILYELDIDFANPQLTVGRHHACVCDVGGNTLYILDRNGLVETKPTEQELCYYSARLNGSDYLAVTEQKSGYKASVSVYDNMGSPVFYFDSYETYICDAIVTEDCKSLAAVSLEPSGGIFASSLVVYDFSSESQRSSFSIRDGLVMETVSQNGRLISLCDKRLCITGEDGSSILDYPYNGLYLHNYALRGDGFCALLLGRYQAGNLHTLTTFSLDGKAISTMELSEEVLDLAASGDFLAVLYSDSLVIYRPDLTEYSRLDGTGYAGQIQFASDGTILLISGTSAWRFRP